MKNKWKQICNSNYYLSSDRLNWIVARRVKRKKCKSFPDGHDYIDQTYHNKLSGAFQRVYNEITRLADTETLDELLKVCKRTETMLKRVLDVDFKEERTAA